jgi:hypothetical protein
MCRTGKYSGSICKNYPVFKLSGNISYVMLENDPAIANKSLEKKNQPYSH